MASGPDALVRDAIARLEIISDTYLSLSAHLQHALPALLGQREKMQKQLRDRISINLAQLDKLLAGQKLVSRLEIEGGWYAVLRVPAVQSDEDLAIRLLEEHSVLVQPGHFYELAGEGIFDCQLADASEPIRGGDSPAARVRCRKVRRQRTRRAMRLIRAVTSSCRRWRERRPPRLQFVPCSRCS